MPGLDRLHVSRCEGRIDDFFHQNKSVYFIRPVPAWKLPNLLHKLMENNIQPRSSSATAEETAPHDLDGDADTTSDSDTSNVDHQELSAMMRQWKDEDVKWMDVETRLIAMSNRLREVDQKIEQLRAVSANGTLIGGFSLVVLAEMAIDPLNTPEWLLTLYASTSAITVCLMAFSFVSCTMISVGLLKKFEFETFDQINKTPFDVFWNAACHRDWMRAYVAYTLGVFSFLINIIFCAWVRFKDYTWPAAVLTVICLITIFIGVFMTHAKWGSFVVYSK